MPGVLKCEGKRCKAVDKKRGRVDLLKALFFVEGAFLFVFGIPPICSLFEPIRSLFLVQTTTHHALSGGGVAPTLSALFGCVPCEFPR